MAAAPHRAGPTGGRGRGLPPRTAAAAASRDIFVDRAPRRRPTDRRVIVRAAASHGGVVRRRVGDPGARALGDAELGGAARNRVGRRRRAIDRAGSSTAAAAAPRCIASTTRVAIVRDGSGPRWMPRAGRFADDREARPRGVGVEPDVAVLVGARAGAVVAGERARDQPALDDRGRQRIGEVEVPAPPASRAASDRSCGDRRCRSSCAPAGGGWSPCRRTAPRRGGRRTGRRRASGAGARSASASPTAGARPAWRARRGRRGRAHRGRRRARAAGAGDRSWRARRRAPDGSGGGRGGTGSRACRAGSRAPRRARAGGRAPPCRPRSGRSSIGRRGRARPAGSRGRSRRCGRRTRRRR